MNQEEKSETKINVFKKALFSIWNSPTSRYATIAAALRSFGGISITIYIPVFFQKVFPLYKKEYAIANAIALSIFGFASSITGGIISDRFEKKDLMSKAYICMIGSALAFPLVALSTCYQASFWLSFSMIALKILVSGSWTSPCLTMMQNTTDSKKQGNIISAHLFYTALAATISPAIFGFMANSLGAAQNPAIYGYLITLFTFFGYGGSVPFFWLAGKEYKKYMLARA